MKFKDQDIIFCSQFDRAGVLAVMNESKKMEKWAKHGAMTNILNGKILAALFFEASTRTRFCYETAMLRLGGRTISNWDMEHTSSICKHETLYDTGKVVSQFADVIVMRHPEPGSVAKLALGAEVPVINGGDGPYEHPTQGLVDLYTIYKARGGFDGLTIGLVGDLKYSRVFHSQIKLLSLFKVKFIFVSPKELPLSQELMDLLKKRKCIYKTAEKVNPFLPEMDVISTTRIQKERFADVKQYEKLKKSYVWTNKALEKVKKQAILLHPLPRVDEMDPEIDKDPRCKYFEQVANGVAVRMAILKLVLRD